ncbi:phosphoribosylanthranilate isomerase [Hahella sp. SMD15-11]|uniref:N-(5'-phosphoribosyl)anthranilate isomerase n=1 Tax=Thermohahella caldifontis TaxID=3142973 RepID=A0AB39UXY5_9GAMM
MRTRIKICGITRIEDALAAVEAGADALGFVFYPPSPRYITPEAACKIIRQLPAFVTAVGLFVNEAAGTVRESIHKSGVHCAQFHGSETVEYCEQFGIPYIKAISMAPDVEPASVMQRFPSASAILLDSFDPKLPGGTGRTFDWQRIPASVARPVILAGGLTPDNVGQAIRQVQPWAVDVSGGVEGPVKGIKDHAKIKQFTGEVYRVNPN